MSEYEWPQVVPPEISIDPDGGFLCVTTCWRPNPDDPDPEMPGQKLSTASYIPVLPEEDCLCGSGKPFRACCRPRRAWRPVCLNPDGQGYSLVAPQSATFHDVDGPVVRARLLADMRLYYVDESIESSFWTLWGDPALEIQYGILCFGDIELEENRTLIVGAISDLRMRVLLDLLEEIAGDCLGEPQISREAILAVDKKSSKPPK